MVGGDHRHRKNGKKIKVLSQQNPVTPVADERAHRHGKEKGEERKGRRLTSDAGEAFLASNWTGTGMGLRSGFPTIATDWISGLWWKGERRDLLLQ